jgi:methyl acetate hydrolase
MDAKLRPVFETAVKEKKVPGVGYFVINAKGDFLAKDALGTTNLQDSNAAPMTPDTVMAIFSCTKLVTSIAALQLIEQGKLSLDDPVEKYFPRISEIQVLESVTPDAEGQVKPVLRPAKTKPLVRHLITHCTGTSYDFFDKPTMAWRATSGRAPMGYHSVGEWEDYATPFVSEPGSKYVYGINIDYLGWVVEAVSGEPLAEYMSNHIFKPLEMNHTSNKLPSDKTHVYPVHFDMGDQGLVANPAAAHNETPTLSGGGGFLYSTLNDYAKLLAALLNNGTSPTTNKTILKPETVKDYVFTDLLEPHVDRSDLGVIGTSLPIASLEGTLLPSMPAERKGWSGGLLINKDDLPYGRKAGSGSWAGLGNLFYWVDPETGIAGMIVSSILPFLNPTIMHLFDELERVAYGHEVAGLGGVAHEKRNYMAKEVLPN